MVRLVSMKRSFRLEDPAEEGSLGDHMEAGGMLPVRTEGPGLGRGLGWKVVPETGRSQGLEGCSI